MAYSVDQILAAISGIESGGNYTAKSKSSTASGKYQWIDGTWNKYGGYDHAWQAPPAVQEQRAREDMARKLRQYGGDVRSAIMSWFLPAAVGNPGVANKVPKANTISPNQYANKVMARLTGTPYKATPEGPSGAPVPPEAPVIGMSDQQSVLANFMAIVMDPGTETARV